MPTNPTEQIDAVKLLSDDEVAEIEARAWYWPSYDAWRDTPLPSREVILTVAERDSLCATVRALRQQNRELKAIVDIGTLDDPGTALAKIHRIQDEATTALREQLAQSQFSDKHNYELWLSLKERHQHRFKAGAWPDGAEDMFCEQCGVSTSEDHAGYDCIAWLQRRLNELQSQLAQVTQERDELQRRLQ